MMVSTMLVILMTIPGLALFYGGLVGELADLVGVRFERRFVGERLGRVLLRLQLERRLLEVEVPDRHRGRLDPRPDHRGQHVRRGVARVERPLLRLIREADSARGAVRRERGGVIDQCPHAAAAVIEVARDPGVGEDPRDEGPIGLIVLHDVLPLGEVSGERLHRGLDAARVARIRQHGLDDLGRAKVLEDAVVAAPGREPERRHDGPHVERVTVEHGGPLLHLPDDALELLEEGLVGEGDLHRLPDNAALRDGGVRGEDLDGELEQLAHRLSKLVAPDLEAARGGVCGLGEGDGDVQHGAPVSRAFTKKSFAVWVECPKFVSARGRSLSWTLRDHRDRSLLGRDAIPREVWPWSSPTRTRPLRSSAAGIEPSARSRRARWARSSRPRTSSCASASR